MKRRDTLIGLGTLFFGACSTETSQDTEQQPGLWERSRLVEEDFVADALNRFPFELVPTSGIDAEKSLERLKVEQPETTPVILGDGGSVARLFEGLAYSDNASPAEIIQAAIKTNHPTDLFALRKREEAGVAAWLEQIRNSENPRESLPNVSVMEPDGSIRELTDEEVVAEFLGEKEEDWPPLGEWPSERINPSPDASISRHWQTGYTPSVYIGLFPTADWTEVPAYLRFGAWNACPPPEYHVAAFKSWQNRYGAELVGLTYDTVELRITRPPTVQDEALELARELYAYCNDLIDQGVDSLSTLAAITMAERYWTIWWD